MKTNLYPLLFKPVYKDYIWGGTRLDTKMQRNTGLSRCAESWEISEREDGMSIVENGALAGMSLADLRIHYGRELLGDTAAADAFPLLIKIIDARLRLSLQVHPNNRNAAAASGEPKTEMWYMLDAEPGACLFAALKEGTDRERFVEALQQGHLEDTLHRLPAAAGLALFVPGGRVHAIGEGCLLLEVQQNSNTTYRVYDWERTGDDGKPRDLHLDKALMVMDWNDHHAEMIQPAATAPDDPRYIQLFGSKEHTPLNAHLWSIVSCDYFRVERVAFENTWRQQRSTNRMEIWYNEREAVTVNTAAGHLVIPAGRSCLMPAGIQDVEWHAPQGTAKFIRITLPETGC